MAVGKEEKVKNKALTAVERINAVLDFNIDPFIYTTEDGQRRLKSVALIAIFRLKHPDGSITTQTMHMGNGRFRAKTIVKDSAGRVLASGSANRPAGVEVDGAVLDAQEWASTVSISVALRNAGFGLAPALDGIHIEDEYGAFNNAEGYQPESDIELNAGTHHGDNIDDATEQAANNPDDDIEINQLSGSDAENSDDESTGEVDKINTDEQVQEKEPEPEQEALALAEAEPDTENPFTESDDNAKPEATVSEDESEGTEEESDTMTLKEALNLQPRAYDKTTIEDLMKEGNVEPLMYYATKSRKPEVKKAMEIVTDYMVEKYNIVLDETA